MMEVVALEWDVRSIQDRSLVNATVWPRIRIWMTVRKDLNLLPRE